MKLRVLWSLAFLLLLVRSASAQQLGQKLLGGIGIDAGVQAAPGLYLLDRFGHFSSGTVRDRNGNEVPIPGLDIDAYANVVGLSWTTRPKNAPYLTFAFGVPLAKLSVNSADPRISVDRSGFGDVFVQPIKVGWRARMHDVVASYSAYIPTGRFEPRGSGGIGRGHFTHEFSAGGAVYLSKDRLTRASALMSWDINTKKRGIDIKRGNTIHVQGGAGVGIVNGLTIGVAGFALWQVSDDKGSDIPPALRGLRTRAFGLGPEVNVLIPKLRLRAEARYETEFGVRARVQGNILVVGVGYQVWSPRQRRPSR